MTDTSELTGQEIAVIGMSGRFPGAPDLDAFWELLVSGQEAISRHSREDLLAAGASPGEVDHPDYVPASGIIDGVDRFDAAFFGYTPAEAEMMDPQTRLLHECVHHALEDAGHLAGADSNAIGIYTGVSANLAWEAVVAFARERDVASRWEAEKFYDKDYIPTRIAHRLDLRGPAVSVTTACSSSLAAVHLACQALLAGECDLAVACGASVPIPYGVGYQWQQGMIASPDGHCRPFDADAAGTVRGSGAGAVVLRLLEEALEEDDAIYAVIKGSAMNNDGARKVGFTAPSVEGQAEVIRDALRVAAVPASTIGFVEAHGTGTPLGDAVEVRALKTAFGACPPGSCLLGSVKSNIGHLDNAAGIAGFIKAVLAIHQRLVPPTLHVREPNPGLGLDGSPFRLCTEPVPWSDPDKPLRAGVSSFGIGGTNVHIILESPPDRAGRNEPTTDAPDGGHPTPFLYPLSARSPSALARQIEAFEVWLDRHPDADMGRVAWTLQQGRRHLEHRWCGVAARSEDLADKLRSSLSRAGLEPSQERATGRTPGVVFLFPGQGAQYPGVGAGLYQTVPPFREAFDRCATTVRALDDLDLVALLLSSDDGASRKGYRTDQVQPLLFSLEYALATTLMSWGIQPVAMGGHSLGELTSACLAGVFSLDETLALVVQRGKLMQSTPPGRMLAVGCDASALNPLLQAVDGVTVAAFNAPSRVVVAGSDAAIQQIQPLLEHEKIPVVPLRTSHAFHTPSMNEAAKRLDASCPVGPGRRPRIPYVSNVTGDWVDGALVRDRTYWGRQILAPVRFDRCVQTLGSLENVVFLEVGPGTTLASLVAEHISARVISERPILSTLGRKDDRDERSRVLEPVAKLWRRGVPVAFDKLPRDRRRPGRVWLPHYPFERQRFWSYVDAFVAARTASAVTSFSSVLDGHGAPDSASSRWPGTNRPESVEEKQVHGSDLDALRQKARNWLYLPSWVRLGPVSSSAAQRVTSQETGTVAVLIGEDRPLLQAVAERIERAGGVAKHILPPGVPSAPRDDVTRNSGVRSIRARLEALVSAHGRLSHLLVWPESREDGDQSASRPGSVLSLNKGSPSAAAFFQVSDVIEVAAGLEQADPVWIGVVSRGVFDLPGGSARSSCALSALGPLMAGAQEYGTLRTALIDLDPSATDKNVDADATRILAAMTQETTTVRLAWRGADLWEPQETPLFASGLRVDGGPRSGAGILRPNGVFLVTGGTGRVGLALAEALATQTRGTVFLASRQAPDMDQPRVAAAYRRIRDAGATVAHVPMDVTDDAQVRHGLTHILDAHRALHGVVHAAGTVDFSLLRELHRLEDRDAWLDRLAAPKLKGLMALDSALDGVETDFCLLVSSLSARLGGMGFAGYAAVHATLDALALTFNRSHPERRWTIVDWDAWQADGDNNPRGEALTTPEGQAVFLEVLEQAQDVEHLIVSRVPPALRRPNGTNLEPDNLTHPRLERSERFAPGSEPAGADPDTPSGKPHRTAEPSRMGSVDRTRLSTPFVPPRTNLEKQLVAVWEEFFLYRGVGIRDNFFDLGGDSLKAIRLLSELETRFGVSFPSRELFRAPTIEHIAALIQSRQAADQAGDPFILFNEGAPLRVFAFPPYVCYGLSYHALSERLPRVEMVAFNFRRQHKVRNPLEALDLFVEIARSRADKHPLVVFGFSAGGRVAYEVVRRLEEAGTVVSDLVLLDAFSRWNPLDAFNPEVETARSEKLLAGFDFLFAGDETLKARAVQDLLEYSRLVHAVEVREPVRANIHLIRSEGQTETEDNRDWIAFTRGNTWQSFTDSQYREYQGFGEHMDMLFPPNLEPNARVLREVFDAIATTILA